MDNFREFCQNEGLRDMIQGVGNYFSRTNYDDEYWTLPKKLRDEYDRSPNVRKYVAKLKQDRVIPLAAAMRIYMQEREPALRIAQMKDRQGPSRDPGEITKSEFPFGMNNPNWKGYRP